MNIANPEDYYKQRIPFLNEAHKRLKDTENRLVIFRLLAFLTACVLFYIFIGQHIWLAFILLITGFSVLGILIKYNLRKNRQRKEVEVLREMNEMELETLKGNYHFFPEGSEYMDPHHPYTSDLDIFGRSSLYQFLNRTVSKPGSKLLAQWLTSPSDEKEINLRQDALRELRNYPDWRQDLRAAGKLNDETASDASFIQQWVQHENILTLPAYSKVILTFLCLAGILATILLLFGFSYVWLTLIVIVNLSVTGFFLKKINRIHQMVTNTEGSLQNYAHTIHRIESMQFKAERLALLQRHFTEQEKGASVQLRKLSVHINRLDYRLNMIAGIVLNSLLLWDIHQCIKLEQWKENNKANLPQWFDAMAEFEVLSSFATIAFNNPSWILPSIESRHFTFQTENMGHPLIPEERRVNNHLTMTGDGKIVIVTGSNMSGKSTFQRTCGVNIVLALAGAPVCASLFRISPVTVFSSMRIVDSLEENTSSFYAELKRLASILKSTERNEKIFILLDEILRGTNSNDRHLGSVALIKQLTENHASGIIATHDLELSVLAEEFPKQIENFNFDVKVENEELYFDYKLNKGICHSLNASLLMRKMGIQIS